MQAHSESNRRGPVNRWLLAISLLAAIPRFYLGATQYIEYDGYWHVFIASQDDWHQFYQEYASNFHPPLFYLLLKVAMLFGRNPLVYRSISLLTGVAAVFVAGKITERLSCNRWTPVVAALAYGLALPSIVISCEVRSYMLSVFFILVSFYYFLDMLADLDSARARSRALFALSAILAGYSHYGAFLYICACAGTAVLFDLSLFRSRPWKRLAHDAVTFGTIAATLAYVYVTHGQPHAGIAEHLRSYYWPASHESLWNFLTVNTQHLLNSFSPFPIPNGTPFSFICASLMIAGVYLVYLIRQLSARENLGAAVTILVGACLLLLILAGGILGKYPYGGELRQQFFLFPFAILSGCILLDRVTAAAGPKFASVLTLTAALAIIGSWSFAFAEYPKNRTELGTTQMSNFRRDFPAPPAIYVDQFNLINLFIHYHDWHWSFISNCGAVPSISIYRVSQGTRSFFLLRDLSRWTLDLREPGLFAEMAKCLREQHLPSLTIFFTRHEPTPIPVQQEPELGSHILTLARGESLCVSKLRVQGARIYAALQPGLCVTDIESTKECAKCDDTNRSISYSGDWHRGEFEQASNATLTYTDDAAAVARFTFEGTELRYWYTRAFNHGLATVFIDGASKGVIDLYSPKIEWQSSSRFGGLSPGRHAVEVRATGRHDPASTDAYIDVDALEAR